MLLLNLLSNAVIYSNRGNRVQVRCLPGAGNGPIVTIEDQGIGIPAEKLPRIFEEYYRTAEAVRHNKESTGLGLAIVRRVAETHGIQIRVESAAGVGTKFILGFSAAEGSA
jgi:signal transduction histidine kinase